MICKLIINFNARFVFFLLLISLSSGLLAKSNDYDIGVFYYPGWMTNELGNWVKEPWDKIKNFPEKEPLMGWYNEADVGVIKQQVKWMSNFGIDYVIFDWYWEPTLKARHGHAIANYLSTENKHNVGFALMWANHDALPKSIDDIKTIVGYWIDNYFNQPEYKIVDGEPLVYIFSAYLLDEKARKFGLTGEILLLEAQKIAKKRGLKGIKFVGGVGSYDKFFKLNGNDSYHGYYAFSAYNYHLGKSTNNRFRISKYSHSYSELSLGYQFNWDWFYKNNKKYIIPTTSGWDKRPWGGSLDPFHDDSLSTPEEFKEHLEMAKKYLDKSPLFTSKKMMVICCWNEYGEGSYIEPTKKFGFKYLEVIKKIFNKN